MTVTSEADDTGTYDTPNAAASARQATILYADMLGFSHRVETAHPIHDPPGLVSRLNVFANHFSSSEFEDKEVRRFFNKKFWAFSDSIVVCWYSGSDAQQAMTEFDADMDQLSSIALAQGYIMRVDAQLVRGGIARGWLLEQGNTVVGTALVKAARIEKEIKTPFIGVDPHMYAYYLNHRERRAYAADIDPTPRLFIEPCAYTNGKPALDYFRATLDDIDLSSAQIRAAKEMPPQRRDKFRNQCVDDNRRLYVAEHRDWIVGGLSNPNPGVHEKYDALKQHHNSRTATFYPGDAGLLVD